MYTERVEVDGYEDTRIIEMLEELSESEKAGEIEKLEIGYWGEDLPENCSDKIVEFLIEKKDIFSNIKSIFFADIDSEENEISWIELCDMGVLINSYPKLEEFTVKGSNGLRFEKLKHTNLKKLTVICGGLGSDTIDDIINAELPNLEHLELYLGVEDYGFNGNVEDVLPIINGELFPKLRYLGLKDSEIQDEIAEAIAESVVLDKIDVLDLSMGTLTDKGGEALLNSSKLKNLKKINLEYHYMSDKMMIKLKKTGIDINMDDQQEADEYDGELYMYPAVTE